MAITRRELVYATLDKADALTDFNVHNDITKRYEFKKKVILDDESLTIDEKTTAVKILTKDYDYFKILYNEGTTRFCEKCRQECLATLYCEHCIRICLKNNFSKWTSGNNDIDNLIQKCQMESFRPSKIIEWIPYKNLQNIKYMTKGGCSEIYSANWIDGPNNEWDPNEQQLKRLGACKVILKKLENIESADRSWFDEAKSHLTISNKQTEIVKCYGLTQDLSNGNYMLVIQLMDMDLRKYLHHRQLTWKEKIKISYDIIDALCGIHKHNAIHRDLHSGNILYLQSKNYWYISDFGFCGPANKPLKSIYGKLPYVAPEIIFGAKFTFASDIYSFGILMWEISSGQLPFKNYEYNYDLAMKIVYGMRPKIKSGIPPEYKDLMKKCWDADSSKRPDINTLFNEIEKMWKDSYNDSPNELNILEHDNNSSQILHESSKFYSLSTTSKIYQFENLPEPRNATEEEQEAFHTSDPNDFSIPDNIEGFYSKDQDQLEISEDIAEKLESLNLKKDITIPSEESAELENLLPYQDGNLREIEKSEKLRRIKKFQSKITKIFKMMSCFS